MKKSNTSKYYKLMEYLRDEMLTGRIMPGDKIPSENMLAEKFSLSRHTVRKSIAILANEGLLYTEHGRGTFSSGVLRKSRDSKNIGVITTYISEYIFPQVISGIDEVLSQSGYSIILKNTGNDHLKEVVCLKDILDKDIAGLIVEPTRSALYTQNIKYYETLDSYGIPYVFIHGCYDQLSGKPCVLVDDSGGMFKLVSYLVKTSHRNICGIFKADDVQGLNRHKGYVKALSESGLNYDPEKVIWFHTEDRDTKPFAALKSMIDNGAKIDAVTCYNDEIAFEIVKLLTEAGIKVPQDISVTGFDDSYLAQSCPVKLTTVRHPKKDLGFEAASMVLQMISEGAGGIGTGSMGTGGTEVIGDSSHIRTTSPMVKVFKPEIILRDSTSDKNQNLNFKDFK